MWILFGLVMAGIFIGAALSPNRPSPRAWSALDVMNGTAQQRVGAAQARECCDLILGAADRTMARLTHALDQAEAEYETARLLTDPLIYRDDYDDLPEAQRFANAAEALDLARREYEFYRPIWLHHGMLRVRLNEFL